MKKEHHFKVFWPKAHIKLEKTEYFEACLYYKQIPFEFFFFQMLAAPQSSTRSLVLPRQCSQEPNSMYSPVPQ
jgi:hypothetical protein